VLAAAAPDAVPLPLRLARLVVQPSTATAGWSHVRVTALGDGAWRADVTLWDATGAQLADATGLELARPAWLADVAAAPAADAGEPAAIEPVLRAQLAAVLGMDAAQLAADTPLHDLGLDSLMALEVCNRLARTTDLRISPVVVLASRTLAELVARVAEVHAHRNGET
jgi:acyl carrier protein